MKYISIRILFTLHICILSIYAQVTFEKTYGGSSSDIGIAVAQTTDGGYIVVGYTSSYGAGGNDVYLIKTDSLGDTLWTKTYGSIYNEYGRSVQQTSDGGYIIAGTRALSGIWDTDMFLLKTDSQGNTQWRKLYGGTGDDWGYGGYQSFDDGYIIAGSTTSFGGCLVYCIKTDTVGDVLWENTYDTGGAWNDGFAVAGTSDSGCVITGSVDWGVWEVVWL